MTGLIYCIGEKPGALVKIGYTTSPLKRLAAIQTGSPVKLLILSSIEGDRDVEASLHSQFNHLRREGEWFSDDDCVITHWFANHVAADLAVPEAHPLKAWMRANRVTQKQMADHLGTMQGHLSRMMQGKSYPSIEMAYAIDVATDGAVPMQSWARGTYARFADPRP